MTPVTGSSIPGAVTAAPRAKISTDTPAVSALVTTYGNIPAGTDGLLLQSDSTNPLGFSWTNSGLPEVPTNAVLSNGWANRDSANPVTFYKDRGRTFLQGHLTAAARTTDTALTLPVGYRPAERMLFMVYTEPAVGGLTARICFIESDGTVHLLNADETPMATSQTYVSLDGINFKLV